jgi:hypothetical protein
MGPNEYVVLFVAVVYFLGGYVLGRFHAGDARPRHGVEPDPLRLPESPDSAEIIPFPGHPAASSAEARRTGRPAVGSRPGGREDRRGPTQS